MKLFKHISLTILVFALLNCDACKAQSTESQKPIKPSLASDTEKANKQGEKETAEKKFKDALIGKPAPAFPEGTKWLNGKPLTWRSLRGKVVLLDFFAEWCGPCKAELPNVSDLHKKRQENGITVIGIHTPGSQLESIYKVVKQYELGYPICIDRPRLSSGKGFGAMSSKYGVNAIPYVFVVDQNGNVACHGWGVKDVLKKANELVKTLSVQKSNEQLKSTESNEANAPKKPKIEKKSSSDAAIYKQLEQNIDLSALNTKISFSDAINQLKNSTQPPLNIIIMWSDLEKNAGINRDTLINIDGINEIRGDAALDILLWSAGGTAKSGYVVKDGVIIIATKKMISGMLETSVYDVADLASPPADYYARPQRTDDYYQMDY